jgi:Fe-coproporphyrin III synthase
MHPPETVEADPGVSVDSVLQVHPTRACNLTCRHCYSVSGPAQRTHLDVDVLAEVLRDAVDLGYTRVSFSGGEPLMYPPLRPLLGLARELGLTTSVSTSGTLITVENAEWLGQLVDVLAVSVDGEPESHNRIRGSVNAYEWTERGLRRLGAGTSSRVPVRQLVRDPQLGCRFPRPAARPAEPSAPVHTLGPM